LRPESPTTLKQGDHKVQVGLEPYGVKFWSFE
jgi:hypothetical protein